MINIENVKIAFNNYVYDFNFDFSMHHLYKNMYLEKFTNRIFEHFKKQEIQKQVT